MSLETHKIETEGKVQMIQLYDYNPSLELNFDSIAKQADSVCFDNDNPTVSVREKDTIMSRRKTNNETALVALDFDGEKEDS